MMTQTAQTEAELQTSRLNLLQEAARPAPTRKRRARAGAVAPSVKAVNLGAEARIALRLMAATKAMTRLSKTESATAGYAFVSIDDYYEQVARKVAVDYGIGWHLTELSDKEQRFQDVYSDFHIRKVFRAIIFSDDGDSFNSGEISVTLPYEDASTTGKALSYADKAFMRQLFKIPTGEPEAELTPKVKKSEAGQQRDAKEKDKFFGQLTVDDKPKA
jgi:hypothetical protein